MDSFFARWSHLPLTALVGVLAVVYGLGLAFGDSLGVGPSLMGLWLWAGAALLGVLFLVSLALAARPEPRR